MVSQRRSGRFPEAVESKPFEQGVVGVRLWIRCRQELVTKKDGIGTGEKTERLSWLTQLQTASAEADPGMRHQNPCDGHHPDELLPDDRFLVGERRTFHRDQ